MCGEVENLQQTIYNTATFTHAHFDSHPAQLILFTDSTITKYYNTRKHCRKGWQHVILYKKNLRTGNRPDEVPLQR